MRCILAVAFAVVLVLAESKVLPASDVENQQTASQTPQLSELIQTGLSNLQTGFSNLQTEMQKNFNLPNQEELLNKMKETSNTYVANTQQWLHNVTENIANINPELVDAWTNFKNKATEAINKMKVDSETTEQLNQMNATFQEGIQSMKTNFEDVAKTFANNSEKIKEDGTKLFKSVVDITSEAVQNFNNVLQPTTPTPVTQAQS